MASDLETTVESLDHPVDNAPVRSLVHKGLTIEGYSRAAVQTYWRIPELKLGFDLGAQPWSFMSTPTWFVSHAHLDHIAALPVYVARRRMMKMEPPTIYLPADAIDGVEMLLRAFQKLDRGRLPANLVPIHAGQEIELSRELVVKVFATKHTVPSLGFLVWERRKKLKPEHQHLSGEEIRDLRLSGVEVSAEIRIPKVAYLGDTAPAGIDALPEVYRAEILIMEMTFVAPGERASVIHKFGHTHLDDILARSERFENEVIVASHFSTRLHPDQIQRIIDKRLPESLRGRLKVWL
ncbi:MBL fold metallo-hydrolase [Singulisphaera rosea]